MCPFGTPLTNTVKSYLASSFRKLGISKRSELEKFMLR